MEILYEVTKKASGRDKIGQTKAIATREKFLRQKMEFKERSCRDAVMYVATLKELVATDS